MVDLVHLRDGVLVDKRVVAVAVVAVAELERDGINQVLLLPGSKRVVEELGLVIVLLELGSASAEFHAMHLLSVLVVSPLALLGRRDRIKPIRPIVQTLGDPRLVLAVSDVIEYRAHGPVYGKLQKGK